MHCPETSTMGTPGNRCAPSWGFVTDMIVTVPVLCSRLADEPSQPIFIFIQHSQTKSCDRKTVIKVPIKQHHDDVICTTIKLAPSSRLNVGCLLWVGKLSSKWCIWPHVVRTCGRFFLHRWMPHKCRWKSKHAGTNREKTVRDTLLWRTRRHAEPAVCSPLQGCYLWYTNMYNWNGKLFFNRNIDERKIKKTIPAKLFATKSFNDSATIINNEITIKYILYLIEINCLVC